MEALYTSNTLCHMVDLLTENISEQLKRRTQWVVHKDKQPYTPGTNCRASTTDLMTWGTFEKAVFALRSGQYSGVGFVFCSADPFVGIDLDKCRNPETEAIDEWAREILNRFEDVVHAEVSPSRTGVHLITRGVCKEGVNTKRVEAYGQDRFFTMTGVLL
jgi:putative DNA primase/helicase